MARKVAVIGSGIVGASVAYHLARDGADVMVIEQSEATGGQATRNSWAWLNASAGNPPNIQRDVCNIMKSKILQKLHK